MKIFKKGNYYFKYNKFSNEYILIEDDSIRFDNDTFNQEITDLNVDNIINSIIKSRVKNGNEKISNIVKNKRNNSYLSAEEIIKHLSDLRNKLKMESFKKFYFENNSIKSVTCSQPISGKGQPII
jgi:hypothetical protein